MKYMIAAFAVLSAIINVGCVNHAPSTSSSANSKNPLSYIGRSSSAVSSAELSYRCPSSPNVVLKDYIGASGSYDYSGAGNYTVCVSRAKQTEFLISGLSQGSELCFYPMQKSNTKGTSIVATPQCFKVTGAQININFSTTSTINYMAIVAKNYAVQMESCLSSTAPCPSHSEGFVQ